MFSGKQNDVIFRASVQIPSRGVLLPELHSFLRNVVVAMSQGCCLFMEAKDKEAGVRQSPLLLSRATLHLHVVGPAL